MDWQVSLMVLELCPEKIEYYYDELDCNVFHLILKEGYFYISQCVYLEEDAENLPCMEFNTQANLQLGGIECIKIFNDKIELFFEEENFFLGKHKKINILIKEVNKKMTDFFNNYLFFGDIITYTDDFILQNKVKQTKFRKYL